MTNHDGSFELVFSAGDGDGRDDIVIVHPTGAIGPSGNPVYRDDTGIIQVEINDNCEARMLPTSSHQHPRRPASCRPLSGT
ncbi:DUF6296 family protein [Streptacidiphilus melanogenes]|uniref:DUF6296 family protein n=1 Tax=Streptacidiphilus melanogenes TaxID=411235 RepID=UPI0005A68ABE|nr:DUF6296 family protein [Streptacidiphilus melanogenes]